MSSHAGPAWQYCFTTRMTQADVRVHETFERCAIFAGGPSSSERALVIA
jgi:hypothetical protein